MTEVQRQFEMAAGGIYPGITYSVVVKELCGTVVLVIRCTQAHM